MKIGSFAICLSLALCLVEGDSSEVSRKERRAKKFMKDLDPSYSKECNAKTEASWNYTLYMNNEESKEKAVDASIDYKLYQASAGKDVSKYEKDYEDFKDVSLYRQIRFFKDEGIGGLSKASFDKYVGLISDVVKIFENCTICSYTNPEECNMTMSDVKSIMATSNNTDELEYYWTQWRNETGSKVKGSYLEILSLVNEAAKSDGYANAGDYWLNKYTVTEKEANLFTANSLSAEEIKSSIEDLWNDISTDLYQPLHAYVRMKLMSYYPDEVRPNMPIPAHVLGSLWAEDWTTIYDLIKPYPEIPDFDITDDMIDENWTIKDMFIEAKNFFAGLGFPELSKRVWEDSVVEQENWESEMLCRPSAVDMCLGESNPDFRVRMCAEINMNDLITIHSKLALIHYYNQYKTHPLVFRSEANPGFFEAIENAIELSVSVPSHLENLVNSKANAKNKKHQEINTEKSWFKPITETAEPDDEHKARINRQMKIALQKVAYLPFGYTMDKFRWDVFSESTEENEANVAWWNLKEKHQGIISPGALRGNSYFDVGSNPFIARNLPAIDKFLGIIMGFQIHKNLCQLSASRYQLDECDISKSENAGSALKEAMEKGLSVPWPKVLKELSGSSEINVNGIKEYFKPLTEFLQGEIEANKLPLGWDSKIEEVTKDLLLQLSEMEDNVTTYAVQSVDASWSYNTNITDENALAMNEASIEFSDTYKHWWEEVIKNPDYEYIEEKTTRRQFEMQKSIGVSILNDKEHDKLNKHLTNMLEKYGNKVCPFNNMKCDKETEGYDIDKLEREMAAKKDYSELLYYWEKWRDVSGREMMEDFSEYIKIINKTAQLNGFSNAGDMWLNPYTSYESDDYSQNDFKNEVEALWHKIQKNYEMLHAYVRYRLKKHKDYGKYIDENDGLIPAHILGNMWAQSWENIYDLVVPYPEEELIDITQSLANWTVEEMFETAESFFTSISLFKMTDDFWENSQFVQPEDREVVCHASAWDFYSTEIDNKDTGRFRIKMCTDKTQDDFITIHHEMGHIEYQMAYSNNMPLLFRDGANPGFHEAIGDTIALSVSTPGHLHIIFPSEDTKKVNEEHQHINFLMQQALAKVAFLPYAYILDQWRWEIFSGNITSDEYNKRWWQKRIEYQGIRPPIARFASEQLDAASKYHVPANVPYIRYFVSHILQFQFHEQLCRIAGVESDFSNCSIYNNVDAGQALKTMLEKGASEEWQDILRDFMNDADASMSASSINNYFQPLWDFLDSEIREKGIEIGWDRTVLDKYMEAPDEISAVVPIVVGVVLVILVAVVLVAFFVGQSKRKKRERKALEAKERVVGEINRGIEMDEKL